MLAAGGATIVALLIFRAVSAVQSYALAQRRAEYQASHDQLTDLPNRTVLSAEVDRILAKAPAGAAQMWVFYIDLEGSSSSTTRGGTRPATRRSQRWLVGLGVVPADATVPGSAGTSSSSPGSAHGRRRSRSRKSCWTCFSDPLQMRTGEVVISASVGIAGVPFNEVGHVTAAALMRDADTAMYQAKSEGPGNWTMFDASMHERVRERVEIEFALRQALLQTDELHLVYQPIVDLRTGTVLGAEALSRWEHPTRGTVPPTLFVPIAEDAGLIGRFGRWVLDESLMQLARWRRDSVVSDDFWMSVNVSPRQLRDAALPTALTESLIRHGVPARAVVLEITESVMIDSSAVTDQVLYDLRSLGVRIVVDDFGTGYSALGYLRRHPVTGVKIDRAFVGGLGVSAKDEEIVRAVVALSGAMGLTVVAEGVETAIQRNVLASLGVALGQGQLWGSGVLPTEFRTRWAAPVGARSGQPAPSAS